MPPRRLEDRIKELCARVLIERDPQWSVTVQELQTALQEHMLRVANLATAVVVVGKVAKERRNN